VRIEIEEATMAPEAAVTAAGKRSLAPWIFGAVMAAVAALLLWAPWREPPSRPVVRTSLNLGDVVPAPPQSMKALAIAPDGARVVFAGSRGGRSQLFLRELDGFDTSAIAGTEGGYGPFFSPDGRWLAFFAGGKLKKVPIDGGLVQNVDDAPNPGGGVWGDGDEIVFVASRYSGLVRVRADGGPVEPVTEENGQEHGSPRLLPDGKAVLMVVRPNSVESEIQLVDLETGARETLVKEADSPAYLGSGHLVYNQAGTLFAVPFDPVRRAIEGQATAVLSGVFVHYAIHAQYDISREGTLVYVPALNPRRLVSVDRNGSERPITAEPGAYGLPRLSPDGKRAALMIYEGMTSRYTWIYDLERESFARLPFDRGYSTMGAWAPDGRSIAFLARLPEYQLFRIQVDGGSPAEPLTEPIRYSMFANSWTPDGRTLVYDALLSAGYDVWTLSMDGEKKASPLLQSRFNERSAELSPDGRFIAYVLDESGRDEIYVQPFPGLGARWKISTNGGTEPCWARSGGELFYREDDKMMAVRIETVPEITASKPAVLFAGRYETSFMVAGRRFYDVFPDGDRFLMIRSESFTGATQLSLVQNWVAEVERLAPAPPGVSMTFPGFRSRCTIPFRWASSRPSAISRP
jgi:serine/threonine-protein kinase